MNPFTDDRHEAVPPVNEFVAGYAAAATRTAYRSDLTLWLAHCRHLGLELFEVRRADIEGYARDWRPPGLRRLRSIDGWRPSPGSIAGRSTRDWSRATRPATSAGHGAHPTRPARLCRAPN